MRPHTLRRIIGAGAVVLALAPVFVPRAGFAAHEPANDLAQSGCTRVTPCTGGSGARTSSRRPVPTIV